jgi:alpha-maltose-1-phosphate synthase
VHVDYLSRALASRVPLTVHAFGADRVDGEGPAVRSYRPWDALRGDAPYAAALETMSVDLAFVAGVEGASVVHSHTWYANLGGHLAKLVHGIPHVATTHSLEPQRPWKAEQLGGGYRLSAFCERTALEAADAVIAVSSAMREDVLASYPAIEPERMHVILNGIDAEEYRPDPDTDVLDARGVRAGEPYAIFVGRITRQKGVTHLLDAARAIDASSQLVLCAGAPDTPELGAEVRAKVEALQQDRGNVIWIEEMLPHRDVIQLLSHAAVFVCPSVYEPLGIVNLEAMACETAVVATAVGGIPEVVVDGETGYLVPFDGGPNDPDQFAADIAERVNTVLRDEDLARRFGEAGRRRAVSEFSWDEIAEQTAALYRALV